MPPKEAAGGEAPELLVGFTEKECKLLAAAFISSIGPDKYDYELMATLTKNTAGSLKKMWPPVKRKTIDAHTSFATFLGQAGVVAANGDVKPALAPKAAAGRKRKAADKGLDDDNDDNKDPTSAANKSDGNKSDTKKKAPAAKGKGRPKKQIKKEAPASEDEVMGISRENSADGGDGIASADSHYAAFFLQHAYMQHTVISTRNMRFLPISLFTFISLQRLQLVFAELFPSNFTSNPLRGIQQFPLSSYSSNMTRIAPVISLSHGGGPMPLLGDPSHKEITNSLKTKVPKILKLGTPEAPKAIVLVTAHWSTSKVTVSSGSKHGLLYDYYGFPPESYEIKHDAPGSPEVAGLVEKALKEAGVECKKDAEREWDHGVFVPMKLIDPKAKTPIVQLSVLASESPSQSYAIGRALSTLRSQNIAIIGSGFATFHNLRLMFSGESSTPKFKQQNVEWSNAVTDAAMTDNDVERERKFEGWRSWPASYIMHPRGGAEHFLPLIVCAGAAGQSTGRKYADNFMGNDMWSYYWDEE
ncbi:Nn.00g006910.m01.CDS01 [Neocucurbitaria sp. VM-36]